MKNTHIYEFFSVSDEQVAKDAGFVEVPQADHVLHAVDGGGMHWLNVGGILGGDPVLLVGVGGREVCKLSAPNTVEGISDTV